MSRCKGKQFINALKRKWDDLEKCSNIKSTQQDDLKKIGPQDIILENEKIEYVKLYDLGPKGCSYLTLAKWYNIKKLILSILVF